MSEPKHVGALDRANARGMSASFLCGSFVRISLRIDESSGAISDAAFTTNGCGFMIATAESVTAWLADRKLAELHGLRDEELRETIGAFPEERVQCMTIVFEALRYSLAEYRARRVEEFRGEKALICTCFGVSEETVVLTIEENALTEIDEVTDICRAGSGCGSCRMLIAELIDARGPAATR